jgi:hypothetical protein
MSTFNYPAMPMYSRDDANYCAQMYDWHTQMAQYQEQKRAYHLESAKHFQQFVRVNVAAKNSPEDQEKNGAA